MARIFGALANVAARYGEGANRKQQYLNEQDRLDREEQRRVFEFAATQDRLREQAQAAAQEREQERLFRAQEAGYADAPDVAGVRAGGAALSAITGMQMGNGVGAVAKEDDPYVAEVEGRQIRAQQKPSQYLTIGGKTLRRNQQADANAAAQAEEAKALWDLKMKREVAQENAKAGIEARGQQALMLEGMRGANRALVAGIAAASRQGGQQARPPQRPTEAQERSVLYADLMREGNDVMAQFADKVDPKKISAYLSSKFFKPALTPEEQQYLQGARSFAAGVYRKESGAAVRDNEVADVMARYVDTAFDAPDTKALKRQRRESYQKTMERLATPANQYYDVVAPEGGAQPRLSPTERLKQKRKG